MSATRPEGDPLTFGTYFHVTEQGEHLSVLLDIFLGYLVR